MSKITNLNVIPYPGDERRRLIASLGKSPSPSELLRGLATFQEKKWDYAPLTEVAARTDWSEENEIEVFAEFLAQADIQFREPEEPQAATPPDPKHQKAAEAIVSAALEDQRSPIRYLRARRMAELLQAIDHHENCVEIIERHLSVFFDASKRPNTKGQITIDASLHEYQVLRGMAECLAASRPKDPRSQVINYFLSDPYTARDRYSMQQVKRFGGMETPYAELAFTRFCYPCEERLDPMPAKWNDVIWAMEKARNPRQMRLVVSAIWELQLGDNIGYPGDKFARAAREFFDRVAREQETAGGVSLWDEETATHEVWWTYWMAFPENDVAVDFISELTGIGRDVSEADFPEFDSWAKLVRRARDLGYIELAQALTAYKLLDEVFFAGRVTNWPSLSELLLELRSYPHFDATATAVRLATETLKSRGHFALAGRLEAFAAREKALPDKVIRFVVEGTKRHTTREEIKTRLIEHLGQENWQKFCERSQDWLIEADLNWSQWRFARQNDFVRKDWSAPALQVGKALEQELVTRYRDICLAVKEKSSDRVTLGTVTRFLRDASRGDQERVRLLAGIGRAAPPRKLATQLHDLAMSFRNAAAHPSDFDVGHLDRLRRLLFMDRLLHQVAITVL
jgi:hypothetical protein